MASVPRTYSASPALGAALGRHAPSMLATLIVFALALEAIHVGRLFLPRVPHARSGAATLDPAPSLAASAWRGLFGAVPSEVAVAVAPGSMTLQGTMAFGDPGHGFAIIRVAGEAGLYPVGADVGGAELKEVHGDHVVLDRGGALEILAMAKPDSAFVLGGNNGPTGEGNGYERPAEPTPAELRASIARATAPLAGVIKAHPLMNDGNFRGLVVEPGADAATFAKLGLRKGDIVMSVDSMPVRPDTFDVLAQEIKSGHSVRMFIKRPGEVPMEIKLNREALAVAAQE